MPRRNATARKSCPRMTRMDANAPDGRPPGGPNTSERRLISVKMREEQRYETSKTSRSGLGHFRRLDRPGVNARRRALVVAPSPRAGDRRAGGRRPGLPRDLLHKASSLAGGRRSGGALAPGLLSRAD